MKILIIHTYYNHRGGEDLVFEQEVSLLNETHKVETIVFYNKSGVCGAFQFFMSIFNFVSLYRIYKKIAIFSPDLIHFHNWHFSLGPAAFLIGKLKSAPIVLTIHNFRLLCPSASLFYNGEIFTNSINSDFPVKAVLYKVYRNSYLQTFWLAFIVRFHKLIGTWSAVDRFVVLTEFAAKVHLSSSFKRFFVNFNIKPNFTNRTLGLNFKNKADYFLFVGRLTEDKGIKVILDAFEKCNYPLKIVGSGPLLDYVTSKALTLKNVSFLGQQSSEYVKDLMAHASALVFPSIWYEGMPMTIIEAFSVGTPVIASNLGAMSTMVTDGFNGLHFEPNSVDDLIRAVSYWDEMLPDDKAHFYSNALSTYEANYTPELNLQMLTDIYTDVIRQANK